MKRPTSVGQLLGKSKWEKHQADWIMATGVGLLGCALRDFEAELGTEMMDGDVSHSSERRLDTYMNGVGQDLFSHLDSS
jgi:hypothetical protein